MIKVAGVTKTEYWGTGRRKESVARVKITPGDGKIVVNSRPFDEYFPRESHRLMMMKPLELVKAVGALNIFINVLGGGPSGQAGAVRHGIARALVKSDETYRPTLKKEGLLTRDPRMRERKKYGRKRARRRFQFTKR